MNADGGLTSSRLQCSVLRACTCTAAVLFAARTESKNPNPKEGQPALVIQGHGADELASTGPIGPNDS